MEFIIKNPKPKFITGKVLFWLYTILMCVDLLTTELVFMKVNKGTMLETNLFGSGIGLILINLFYLGVLYLMFVQPKTWIKEKYDKAFIYTTLIVFLSVARIKAIINAIKWLKTPPLIAEQTVQKLIESGSLTTTAKTLYYFTMVWQTMLQPLIIVMIIWLIYRLSYRVETK